MDNNVALNQMVECESEYKLPPISSKKALDFVVLKAMLLAFAGEGIDANCIE